MHSCSHSSAVRELNNVLVQFFFRYVDHYSIEVKRWEGHSYKKSVTEVLQTFTTRAVGQKVTEEIKSYGHLHNLFTKSEETAELVVFTGFNLAFLRPAPFLTER